jgi:formylglycine-generating enzyme required for sulfatase activity
LSGPATELWLSKDAVLANRYRVERELGEGGMGRVYAAWDEELECRVAIKTLRQILGTDALLAKRLKAEAKLSMDLTHPNIVRVHNLELDSRIKFLVMEYVEGESLAQRIGREEKLGEEETRRTAIEICKGLEHAHDRNIIHRDLKSANILLGKNGAVKVADFGIARVCQDSMTRLTGEVIGGTLLYMSPEQLAGKSTKLSDLYSLGALMYEMLSGQPPFHAGLIAYQIENHQPESIEGISAEMNAMVLRLLEKKPEDRFGSVRELREELERSAAANRKAEEARAAAMRRAEEERLRAEERRKEEEARRRMEEQRKEEERRKQAELEANRRKEEEARKQEEGRRKEEQRKRAAAGLAVAALALFDRGAFGAAETKLQEALSLDPGHAEAKAALDRCRAERAAAEERRRRAQSQKTPLVAAKANYRRRAAIGLVSVGMLVVFILVVFIWLINSPNGSQNKPASQTSITEGASKSQHPPINSQQTQSAASEKTTAGETKTFEPNKKQPLQNPPISAADLALKAELSFWESIKNSNDPAVFRDYLAKYPSGGFSEVAISNIRSIEITGIKKQIREYLDARSWDAADQRITDLLKISPDDPDASTWKKQISAEVESERTSAEISKLKKQIGDFISVRDWSKAGVQLENLLKMAPNDAEALSWRRQLDREIENERATTERKPAANSYGIEFVSIPAGKFMMGCSLGDSQCAAFENPRHEVTISRGFELGKYEVTQGQWVRVMENNPSYFKGDDRLPVEQVSWSDAEAFIANLNAANDGYGYRLPTEAEWEYAARGGTEGPYYGDLDAISWNISNSGSKTHPVGQKQPNGYGLYDMLGNVDQWCWDWYGDYGSSPAIDPRGPSSGQYKVLRGLSIFTLSRYARVSNRARELPANRRVVGFRVCREKLSSFGTAVAKNASELDALRRKGERDYFEFSVSVPKKEGQATKVGDIQVILVSTDVKKGKFTIDILVDDNKITKKDSNVNEPLAFLVGKNRLRYELVINWVQKDKAGGYLSIPKDKTLSSEKMGGD